MKKRVLHGITVGLFWGLIFFFSLAFLISPDKAFSEQENRSLRTLPRFSVQRLASGEYASDFNDYFADQFPLRDAFVGLKAYAELAMGKGENDGILLGKKGTLARRSFDMMRADGSISADMDAFDAQHIADGVEGIKRAADTLDVPLSVVLTGRNIDVASSAFSYPAIYSRALWGQLRDALADDVRFADTVTLLRERYDTGEAVWYRTDHHWTTLGAYYAYAEILCSFGMESEILPREAFAPRVASTDFYGSLWSASGMKFVPPDTVEFWLLGNENEFDIVADGYALDGFYTEEHLTRKDHYSAFLDGTHDVVTVTKRGGEERPTLLLLKDSFANSLAPFLAQHFDLVLLNLSSARTDYTDVSARVEEYEADAVLIVYTLENVIGTQKMNRLR